VTEQTLRSVFVALAEHRVVLEGMLLKPNMVLSGKECPKQASVQEVAEATVRCMKHVVPAAVPGLVFLSGGQTDQQATEHLNAMNQLPDLPWQGFSYMAGHCKLLCSRLERRLSECERCATGIPSSRDVQQQGALRQIHRRHGEREGGIGLPIDEDKSDARRTVSWTRRPSRGRTLCEIPRLIPFCRKPFECERCPRVASIHSLIPMLIMRT
jgi:hypothetical protein